MKKPTEKQLSILLSKIRRYTTMTPSYGGCFTNYEILLLVDYFKVSISHYDESTVRWCKELTAKGQNSQRWFYFDVTKKNKLRKHLNK